VLGRVSIVKAVPALRGAYEAVGLKVPPAWDGLHITNIKSELRYDSGTMKLYVDALIHNSTDEVQFVPEIKASAMGVDGRSIQSWVIDPPAVTLISGGDLAVHSETMYAMERTVDSVRLEFVAPRNGGHER